MEVTLVLCPPCSGTGKPNGKDYPSHDVPPLCGLCSGTGEITEAVLEEFWACVLASRYSQSQPALCVNELAGVWR